MIGLILRYPLTSLGALGLLMLLATFATDADYDSPGALKGLWWLSSALTIPLTLLRELFFSFTNGESRGWQMPLAVLGHIAICLLFDWVLNRFRGE